MTTSYPTPTAPFAVQRPASPAQVRVLRLLLLIALGFALLGQSRFDEGRPYPTEGISAFASSGIALYVVAIAAFTLAVVQANRLRRNPVEENRRPARRSSGLGSIFSFKTAQELTAQTLQALRQHPRRSGALLLAGLLTIVLLNLLSAEPPLTNYTLPFILWLSAIGLYVRTTVFPLRSAPKSGAPWWKTDWPTAAALLAITLATFVLRVWHIESIPPTLAGDEGTFGLESIKTITGEINNPFTTGWLSVPTLSFFFNSLSIRLFGQTMFALRLPWALIGTITIPIAFQLTRRLAGRTLGLMTALLLATYHFHIHYSRLGVNNISDPLLIALVLLLFYRAVDRRSRLDWALCGVAIGAAQYFYFGARFAVILVGVLLAYLSLRDGARFWREQGRGILILIGAAIIAGAPMIQYAIRYPLDYNARVNQIGVIQSGWLDNEQIVRNEGAFPILIDQLQRAALAFNAYPDRTGWYGLPQPLFDFVTGILFLLGLGYATLRLDDRRLFPMVAWWWGAMILGGALTESPPSSMRLITLALPAVFFVGLALVKLGHILQHAWRSWTPQQLAPYGAAVVLIISWASAKWYFSDFTPLRVYGTFNAVVATEMATYAHTKLGADWRMYFFGAPRMYHDFGTIPYIAPEVEATDVIDPLVAPPDASLVQPDKNAAFIFLPERRAELQFVQQTFPGGALEEIPSFWEGDPNPLFIVYRVLRPAAQ
ncbi:MAG TPA: glycosyltransferase family 39 protein [Anaerolineae bacterium]|nr:glycosyltransferase family 39 protein [Anaerolineae bacterium]